MILHCKNCIVGCPDEPGCRNESCPCHQTFEQIQHRLLVASLKRLKVFVERAPHIGGTGFARVIGGEIALIVERASGVFGDAIYAALGERAVQRERIRLGFCVTCKDNAANDEVTIGS